MDFKVLKSFVSAHEAVNWLTQNRIEDTSIETTGTLKSMGLGPVPSGNYHVVLKRYTVTPKDVVSKVGINPSQAGKVSTPNLEELQSQEFDPETGRFQPVKAPHSRVPIEQQDGSTNNPKTVFPPDSDGSPFKRRIEGRVDARGVPFPATESERGGISTSGGGTRMFDPEEVKLRNEKLALSITKAVMEVLKSK